MARNITTESETAFDRAAWLTLGLVVIYIILGLGSALYILTLPTDGWQIPYNSSPPPLLTNFAGDWRTPLQTGDRVLAVAGLPVSGGEAMRPRPADAYQEGETVTYSVLRNGQQLEIPVKLHRLGAAGIWRSFWYTMQDVPIEMVWSLVAIVVFFLRPRNPAARLMFLAFLPNNVTTKLIWAATTISHNFAPAPIFYPNTLANSFWSYLFFPSITLLILSFPRPVFPLTRWPRVIPALLYSVPFTCVLLYMALGIDSIATVVLIIQAVLLVLASGSALYSARKHTDPAIRAQGLWVIFGFALCIIPILVGYLLDYMQLVKMADINPFYNYFTILVLPASLAIAITRYHLFDIYLIIRRTLQYTLITGLLALVYFGGIVLLQSVFRAFTGQAQDIAIVLSTLAIAALFTPLRLRVQNFIDRRFFRSKYNAEQILSRFAATARGEVAMEPLTLDLLNVIDETMQPENISLWLKVPAEK